MFYMMSVAGSIMGWATVSPEFAWVLLEIAEFDVVLQSEEEDSVLLYTILATLGFFGGVYAIYLGTDTYQKYSLVKNTATERVRSIAMGRTEVNGVVRPAGQCPKKPFADEDCVYAYWRMAEYTPSKNDEGETEYSWNTKAVGSFGTEFYLEGESGREVLVDDPSDGTVTLTDEKREETFVGRGDEPDERIGQFCKSQDLEPTSKYRRRYRQDVIVPGDMVYVLGQAVERDEPVGPNNEDKILLTEDDASDTFIVSDKSEADLQDHYRTWSMIYLGGGLAVAAYSLWAWFVNAGDGGYGEAITGAVIGLAMLGVIYYERERVAKGIDKFKGDFG